MIRHGSPKSLSSMSADLFALNEKVFTDWSVRLLWTSMSGIGDVLSPTGTSKQGRVWKAERVNCAAAVATKAAKIQCFILICGLT